MSAEDQSPPGEAPDLDLTAVIPCLNEERTVGRCVQAALEGIRRAGLRGEVIVADNGSTDQSRERAAAAGARVVPVARRGYGAALQAGFLAARGRLLVMGDADLSYDFRHIPRFAEEQRRSGADMVVGNRFRGGISPGAMPWSHRRLGNPLISWVMRRITGVSLGDCYCGLRLITRDAHRKLRMTATGMEYALEMIVKASLAGLRLAEVPTTLRVDGRDHAPHLKTMRDGYRSFRFLFQHAPITAFFLPGALLAFAGACVLAVLGWDEMRGGPRHGAAVSLVSAAALLLGGTLVVVGTLSRTFAMGYLGGQSDTGLRRLFHRMNLEWTVALALATFVAGACAVGMGQGRSSALLMLGLSVMALSVQALFSAFLVSLMGRAVPDNRFYLVEPGQPLAASPRGQPAGAADAPGGQNVDHSLATQTALSQATHYNAWLLDSIGGALDGARRVLDVGCSMGNISALAAERLAASGDALVTGLEVIPEAAEAFRLRFGGRRDLEVIEGDIGRIPEALRTRAPFDAAISLNVLEHVEDDIGALMAIGSLLRPGGRLGLLVPGGGDLLFGTLDRLDCHFRRYTAPKLGMRLEEAGFEVLTLRPVNLAGFFLWFLKGRVLRSRSISPGDVRRFDRWVPHLRKLDRLLGPPFGQSLAAVAIWRGASQEERP